MAIIERGNTILGTPNPGYATAGAPTAAVNAAQTVSITGTPTGGTFTLTIEGRTTAAIAYNAAASAVQTALLALDLLDTGDVVASGGALPGTPVVLTFGGNYAGMPVSALTASGAGLTGGTSPAVSIAQTTAGVAASGRGGGKGALLTDTTNGLIYANTGTALSPTWTKVGLQS
jgi:hypothetical protein